MVREPAGTGNAALGTYLLLLAGHGSDGAAPHGPPACPPPSTAPSDRPPRHRYSYRLHDAAATIQSRHTRRAQQAAKDLRAYFAALGLDGRVVDLLRLAPYNTGWFAFDDDGERILDSDGEPMFLSPTITSEYPPQDGRSNDLIVLFPDIEHHDNPAISGLAIWIGGAGSQDQ